MSTILAYLARKVASNTWERTRFAVMEIRKLQIGMYKMLRIELSKLDPAERDARLKHARCNSISMQRLLDWARETQQPAAITKEISELSLGHQSESSSNERSFSPVESGSSREPHLQSNARPTGSVPNEKDPVRPRVTPQMLGAPGKSQEQRKMLQSALAQLRPTRRRKVYERVKARPECLPDLLRWVQQVQAHGEARSEDDESVDEDSEDE
ncbi:hypothetical protein LTR37_002284 [Vermiconidia calcicola]|uniref:Uncharacterized protein n=1 Tax=Vermiconidia calcicola TaxID=1690605 RepID=A0ACC3NTP2_9PEZI|nr:hypothetical protein LTR37_002284 [Vermiconidia calcicola]